MISNCVSTVENYISVVSGVWSKIRIDIDLPDIKLDQPGTVIPRS